MIRTPQVTNTSSILGTQVRSSAVPMAPEQWSKPGASGERVAKLQRALAALGFNPGPVTGKFDARTEKALKAFQAKAGLAQHGIYGPETGAALKAALAKEAASGGPALREGDRGAAVRKLERALVKQGLLDRADGTFDAATAKAVKALEKKHGWTADGVVGEKLWQALGNAGSGSGPQLKRGDKGADVKILQRALAERGLYKGAISGTFDAATGAALKAFEKAQGLTADGKTDGKVWSALQTHVVSRQTVGGPTLREGTSGQAVRTLQKKLRDRGLYTGPIDGKFGASTEAAVKRFEKRRGAKVDGVVGNGLWVQLGGAGLGSGPRLKEGAQGETVKVLQRRLAALGHYDGPIDGDFGAGTKAALKRLEKKAGLKADGIADARVWAAVGRHVVMKETDPSAAKEPAHDYRRTNFRGGLMNVRTKVMLQRAETYAKQMGVPMPVFIVQGSYSNGVSASGGTHDGGGALDIRSRHLSVANVKKLVKALRMAGFAAWSRGYGKDSFDPHIHAIAIGDRQLSGAARNQVAEYFRGGDGLVGSAGDGDAEVGRPWPKWANKYR